MDKDQVEDGCSANGQSGGLGYGWTGVEWRSGLWMDSNGLLCHGWTGVELMATPRKVRGGAESCATAGYRWSRGIHYGGMEMGLMVALGDRR